MKTLMRGVIGVLKLLNHEEILERVRAHHQLVEDLGFTVVMTSLVGSQNYGLADDTSDIDTYSFVLPSFEQLATAEEPDTDVVEADDGLCNIKDIRLALNLLQKTSPNSIEYFTSKYQVYNPKFESVLKEYLEDKVILYDMIHANTYHMLSAMAGMARQLVKRNMPAGKRCAHALRLQNMLFYYFTSKDPYKVLDMRGDEQIVLAMKRDTNTENDESYNKTCIEVAEEMELFRDNLNLSKESIDTEECGKMTIVFFQKRILAKYLEELHGN